MVVLSALVQDVKVGFDQDGLCWLRRFFQQAFVFYMSPTKEEGGANFVRSPLFFSPQFLYFSQSEQIN